MSSKLMHWLLVAGLLFSLSACSGKHDGSTKMDEEAAFTPEAILVLPAEPVLTGQRREQEEKKDSVRQGAEYMNSLLRDRLFTKRQVVFADSDKGFTTGAVQGGVFGAIQEVGRKYGADTVLYTTVSRFKQREGDGMAADAPSSCSFEMRMIRVDTGAVIWSTSFSETQEALLDNIFSIGKAASRGFRWVSVEELMEQGLDDRLKKCTYLQ